MNREALQKALAVAGSLLLVIAPFAPFISAPIFGRITLFQQGKGDGILLLVIALVALGLSLIGRYGVLWVSSALGLFEIGNLFYFFYHRLPNLIDQYKQQTNDNIFGSLGEITLSNVDPDWGAMVLLLGTLTTLGVAVSVGIKGRAFTLAGMTRVHNKAAHMTIKCALIGALMGTLLASVPVVSAAVQKDAREQAIIERYRGTGNGFDVPVRDGVGTSSGTLPPSLIVVGTTIGAIMGAVIGNARTRRKGETISA
jgi:hypothetical protein